MLSGTDGAASHLWLPGKALQKVIERTGFRINTKKTHLMYRDSRQNVTGLVVNEKINVRWEYRHNVRAMVHSLVKTGTFEIRGVTQRGRQMILEKRYGTLDELHGMLGFIDSIDVYNKIHASDCQSNKMSSKEKVYREFLIYSIFYAAQVPVVLCEGETDNVYLTHAIQSLAVEFPDLAEVMPDKEDSPQGEALQASPVEHSATSGSEERWQRRVEQIYRRVQGRDQPFHRSSANESSGHPV